MARLGMTADVVVVGGGPAGTTTALALADASPALAARVVILEKARYPRDKPCAGALGARGDRLLAGIGVRAHVPSVVIDGMSFRGTRGEAFAEPGGIGRVVRRTDLDASLAKAASARGVDVRDGVRVERVRDEGPRGAVVETSAGELRARVVVGCDGVGSVVRRALGMGAGAARAQAVEVDTDPIPSDRDRRRLHFDASDRRFAGYAWDFPTVVDGRPAVCRGVYRLKRESDGRGPDVGTLLAERLNRLGIDPKRYPNKRFAERGYEPASRVAGGSLMLAGEAAGIDALTGEGIAQAIEYGVLAGRFLASRITRARDGRVAVEGWERIFGRSRLARELRLRRRLVNLFYGPRRPVIEGLLAMSSDAVMVGCQHFGGHPRDWRRVGRVVSRGAAGLLVACMGEMLAG